jgi:conjugative transfer signal peptidase TraF
VKRKALILVPSAAAVGVLGLSVWSSPRLIWNVTASAPEGLYWLQARAPGIGDLVAVRPTPPLAAWLDRRGYVPSGALLIKRLAAAPPSVVCRSGALISIDGNPVAQAQRKDLSGRSLPAWKGCVRLGGSQVLLLNDHSRSLDGRYFGPIDRTAIVGRVAPLWLIGSADHAG